jgi:putative transposase
MPRGGRVIAPGYPHHIVQRGHNRQTVFFAEEARSSYLATLCEFREKLGVQVYAYCLMTNHVHLIVNPGNDAANLSLLMKRLAGRHTRRLNKLNRRTGTSWEGRFKCSPIQSSTYLLACARYVDLNPVRAHIVRLPEDYLWSSYRAHVGLSNCPWLDPNPCLLALAHTTEQRQQQYREFVARGIPEHQIAFLRTAVQRNQLTGSAAFILEIEQLTGTRVLSRRPGRPVADKERESGKK